MSNVKTAISLQKSIFEQAEEIAEEMQISRSRLYVLALENFIREYKDKELYDAINNACETIKDDPLERSRMRQIRKQHRRIVEGEW